MYTCVFCEELLEAEPFNSTAHDTASGRVCTSSLGCFENNADAKNAGKRRSEDGFPAFNYGRQIWLLNGKEIPAKQNWDFPCHNCQSPAAMEGFNSHYEAYRCLCCNHITKVN